MPLTNQQLGLDPKAPDNDYQGDDEVLAFAEAAEHLNQLGDIGADLQSRLTFEITFTSRHLNHNIPNYWAVYLDHKEIGTVTDGSFQDPDSDLWKRLSYEVYSTGDPHKTDIKAFVGSTAPFKRLAYSDEYHWDDYCGDAYWASFNTLEEMINRFHEDEREKRDDASSDITATREYITEKDNHYCETIKHPICLGNAELRIWERHFIPSKMPYGSPINYRYAARLYINGEMITGCNTKEVFPSKAHIIHRAVQYLNTYRENQCQQC